MKKREELILDGLNEAQKEAVVNILGPSLVIAGAGSGKTKVLTCKLANIIAHGYSPYSIMALTFTNKAAGEMRERISDMVGSDFARRLYVGTFHSIFLKFLIDKSEILGYPKSFTIYNKDDQKSLIKRCIKELELDDKVYKPNEISSRISECKNNLITSNSYTSYIELMESDRRSKRGRLHEVFSLYTKRCIEQGVMDFDDILLSIYRLAACFPDEFDKIRRQFNFLLVDEYQDTNHLQYLILKEFTKYHDNITVVGDDSQSIYAFRGARIENILNFQKDYPNAKIFRLERNYRSTQMIVDAANSLINNNKNRIEKRCFSKREEGEKIRLISAYSDKDEANQVVSSIIDQIHKTKARYDSFAILYRINSLSRVMEEALRSKNIPFKIYQGHSFYDRAEIKNMVAYLRLILNPKDDEAFKRVVNFPKRGIGATSMEQIISVSRSRNLSLSESVKTLSAEQFNVRPSLLAKVTEFVNNIEAIRKNVYKVDAFEIAQSIDQTFAITRTLEADTSLEGQTRLDYVQEFFNSIKSFVNEGNDELSNQELITLDLYLQNVALIADSDVAKESSDVAKNLSEKKEEDKNRVALMTIHAAKGLEFPFVYVIGLEENLFPSAGLYNSSPKEIEEERRLFYVAITRAEENLNLSFAENRLRNGEFQHNSPSRFLKEIDSKFYKNPHLLKKGANQGTPLGSRDSFFERIRFPRFEQSNQTVLPSVQPKIAREDFIPDSPTLMKVGQRVEHERFGIGVIKSMSGEAQSKKAVVLFESGDEKTLMLKFAKMKILD